jgi:cardiolipin synthase A/B
MNALKRMGLGAAILLVIMLGVIGLLSFLRGTPVHSVLVGPERGLPPAVSDPLFARTMEQLARTHIGGGNHVEILQDGDGTYPLLWRDILAAQETLNLQLYFSIPGVVADTMAMHLANRARAGVKVLLLLDAFGSQHLRGEWVNNLRDAGVDVQWLRPMRWYKMDRLGTRSHVRAIIIDGRIGYTGGFGLADYWLGDGRREDQWRETNVRFTGPAVSALQAAFVAAWAEATGELIVGERFFPAANLSEEGGVSAGLLFTTPTLGSTAAERFMAISIASARERLYVANSYFVPSDDFRRMLVDAARRGVDVRILTAGPASDISSTRYAGRSYYEELMVAGVRIYEYTPTMMHAKTFVIDGMWSTIGSLNFDNRSLAFNDESNIVVLDAEFGAAMEEMFMADLEYSEEILLDEFRQRSRYERFKEWGASRIARVL